MDTVLSAKGSNKCILTFYIPETGLFLGRLLNRCTEGAVKAAIDRMGRHLELWFPIVFGVYLTGCGSEFGDPYKKTPGTDPYQLSLKKFGLETLRALQLKYIEPDDATLTPKLLK